MPNLLDLLDELRAIAQLGLLYTQDSYDKDRYERLLSLAAESYSDISGLGQPIVLERFKKELGYITPKVGVSAAIVNDNIELLLVKRSDDQCWCLPCGWTEAGETPQESIEREVLEETGLYVKAGELIRLGTRKPGDFGTPHASYHLQFACSVKGGSLRGSNETSQVAYYDINSIKQWHRDHDAEARAAITYYKKFSTVF